MYKLLLCWRYLLTRYLALACIISVMLGVATLIVVNSVMGGFSTKLKDRLHSVTSDIVVEGPTLEGFGGAKEKMQRIRESLIGHRIQAMAPTLEIFAILQYPFPDGEMNTRLVRLIGIEPESRVKVGGFSEHLFYQKGASKPSFDLPPEVEAWFQQQHPPPEVRPVQALQPDEPPPPFPPPSEPKVPKGIIVGNATVSFREKSADPTKPPEDIYLRKRGEEVIITTVSGAKLAAVQDRFVVCDYFKSEMSEIDSSYVFVPLDYLQMLRTMEDRVTSIQIKLKDYRDAQEVVEVLQAMFPDCQVATWEKKQGALLAAISIERGILNILLFMIIAVAGFGILAIFAMIVVEKTRDIGILKALGASNGGVMSIFLGYGWLLGLVGAGFGTALGIAFTININEIEKLLARITGQEIFDRSVYYFDKIPTDIQPMMVLLVNAGAIAISVAASIFPALRAALLHPVRALRYE